MCIAPYTVRVVVRSFQLFQSMLIEFSSMSLLIFVAEYGASEDSVQRQSSSGAAPTAAAGADDGAAAGPDPDRLRRVQEPLDPLAVENLPDLRPGMLRN